MSDLFLTRLWPKASFVLMLLAWVLLLACGSVEHVDGLSRPEPELRLDIQTDDVGPSRTDVRVLMTNVGSEDVLVEASLTLPGNAGSARDSGPTRPAKIMNENGREVGGNTAEPRTMIWVPERLRAGTTLTWVVALRCLGRDAVEIGVRVRSVEVGGVSEAVFEEVVGDAQIKCPLPRVPGS
jgi:hypothetical protein